MNNEKGFALFELIVVIGFAVSAFVFGALVFSLIYFLVDGGN